jgi:hypothetical protein
MKTFKFFLPVSLMVAFFFLVISCNKESKVQPQQPESVVPGLVVSPDIKMDEAKLAELQAISSNVVTTRTPISYIGQLCPGVTVSGSAPTANSIFNSALWDYYSFNGCAGDVVTIYGPRTGTCNMDPAFYLAAGKTTDSNLSGLTVLAFADDEVYNCGGCFADPLLSGYVLPTTGVYTVAFFDYLSCGPDRTYDLTVTGIPECTVVIDGCDSGVPNMLTPSGSLMSCDIAACAAAAGNHGDFVSCVAHLTNEWKAAGLITGAQKGAIQSCAAGANIP